MLALETYNSFGIKVFAHNYLEVDSVMKLKEWRHSNPNELFFILGEGSNILFSGDQKQMILINRIMGIRELKRNENYVTLEVGSGENWHNFVEYCVEKNYGGIENLALIPGSLGAAPVQNIGAYGREIKDVLKSVKYFDMDSLEEYQLLNIDCEFGYRDSIFKNALKGKAYITSIILQLTTNKHELKLDYGAIRDQINSKDPENISIKEVFDAVVNIRRNKLPDPKVLGNAGSYFKNPIISPLLFQQLKHRFPSIPHFISKNGDIKLAAGWLIDKAGWKGKRSGPVSCYEKQALVIVNHGGATAGEILAHAFKVKASVFSMFGVELEEEVNLIAG